MTDPLTVAKGYPFCPVCHGRGYFFVAPAKPRGKERFVYCDCAANVASSGVAVVSSCFLHGDYGSAPSCPKCEKETTR